MIGRTIGKYRIAGQLGRGGAGIVYHAVDETLHRDVAVKTLNPALADTEIMQRFRAEATILARLNHPQIATIYDLFRSGTDLLMIMEYVRGETLEQLLERCGPLAPERAAYLTDQILSALEHAHRAGVVHRDVKPANVMVTATGGVKIMDFGIARVRGAEQMTVDGRLMGTPAYMPPEQVLGEEVDGRADLYAVGVVFYRLLTGALPFTADTQIGMLQRQVVDTPAPVHEHRADLPDWCDAITRRALSKSPADRFQTAEEFREALNQAAGPLAINELAKTFACVDAEVTAPSLQQPITDTLVMTPVHELGTGRSRSAPGRPDAPTTGRRKGEALAYALLAAFVVAAAVVAYAALGRAAVPLTKAATSSAAPARAHRIEASDPTEAPRASKSAATPMPASRKTARRPVAGTDAPLLFETKALVGSKGKQRERSAHLALAEGRITVTADDATGRTLYSVPYESVLSISYSRGRDPLWNSPRGPAPVTRAGGTLGRMGIFVEREWIALRTTTKHQFVAMRFEDVLVKRVLIALEERTGRTSQLVALRKEDQ